MQMQNLCKHPEIMKEFGHSKVTGALLPVFCVNVRSFGGNACGREGKLWEPKGEKGGERYTDIQSASGEQRTSSKDNKQG